MSEQDNVQTVQQVYAAWQRGDIPAVLDAFTDDIAWLMPGPSEIVPHAGTYRGREQMAQYFAVLSETLEFEQYELAEFVAQGEKVVVLGRSRGRARATGNSFADNYAHYFELRGGKIARMRYYSDTAAIVAALTMPARAGGAAT